MASDGRNTERTSVKTYIPVYQREEWERHAEQLDMSRSEFIRTMVQVGRQSFDGTIPTTDGESSTRRQDDASESEDSTDQNLDDRIVEELSEGKPLSWDELLAAVTDDVEDRLDAALNRLQQDNVVQHDGREGGYKLLEDHGD